MATRLRASTLVVLGLLTLCGLTAPAAAQEARTTLNVALFGEPDFLDPHVATSVGFVPIDNAYESLVYTERDSTRLVPSLAESWTTSQDGRTFTFKLRRGVKFHDGTEMDAESVRFSYDRLRRVNKGPAWVLAHVESVEVKDPLTVEIRTKAGGPPFPESFSLVRIVSPKTVKEKEASGDLAQDFLNRQSAGTGPYRIVSWQRSQRVVLRKFDAYWGGWKQPNHFATVNMLVIPEASTQRLMLEKGEIDMAMKFPAEALPALEKNPDIQVVRAQGLRILYLRLQNAAPPTSDVRVRQAINYAFDFPSFQKAMENTYDPPTGPVPVLFLGDWSPKYPYTYDLAKAKALLQAAGYTEGRRARMIADILIATPEQRKAAEILQAGLQATGLAELDIREQEWPVMLKHNVEWQKTKDPATAHHFFGLFTPPRVPDPFAYLWYTYHSKAIGAFARNVMNYSNPKVDELLDKAALTTNRTQKISLYRQAAQIIVDEAPDLFLGTQTKVYLLRKGIKGFYPHPLWYPTVPAYGMSRE
jgi:peptide/nickel transport system substrate-binding protein